MKTLLFGLLLIGLVGCAGPKGVDGSGATVTTIQQPMNDIQTVVANENAYRVQVGQTILTQGLVCNLYTIPNTTTLIIGATGLVNKATFTLLSDFDQADSSANIGLNILPTALQTQYTSWYIVKCTGQIVVTASAYYGFDLTSDDGSNLYLDGAILINNDGNHGAQLRSGSKLLKLGIHSVELDYMQGPGGNQALMLYSAGTPVPAANLYH